MHLYFRQTLDHEPKRIQLNTLELIDCMRSFNGQIVASFEEWWGSLDVEEKARQVELIEDESDEAIDLQEQAHLWAMSPGSDLSGWKHQANEKIRKAQRKTREDAPEEPEDADDGSYA